MYYKRFIKYYYFIIIIIIKHLNDTTHFPHVQIAQKREYNHA